MSYLPTNTRPLFLEGPSIELASEWKKCIKDRKSDLTYLMKMLEPVFIHWVKLLQGEEIVTKDINYVTLCRLISKDQNEAYERIHSYVISTEDLLSEIHLIFVKRIRKMRFCPTLATPLRVEYIIASYLKWDIYNSIIFTTERLKRNTPHYPIIELPFEENYFEKVLLREIRDKFSELQYYLYYLISHGFNLDERSEITNFDRRNLYKEEKIIWHLIKKKL